MQPRLLNLWESLKTSYWFLPGLLVLAAIVAAFAMIALDRWLQIEHISHLSFLYTLSADGARSVLSTIAGSTITVAGVAFSITIVALTLASSQFGPRLLRNFMKDTGNQIVLGTLIATFIYCLLVLRAVSNDGDAVFIPQLALSLAMLLALTSVGVLIYFIHHVAVSIQADQIVATTYRGLMEDIDRLLPSEGPSHADHERQHPGDQLPCSLTLRSPSSGYVQAIDVDWLTHFASKQDVVIELTVKPGRYITIDSLWATVYAREPLELDAAKLAQALLLGAQRTPEQDAEFALHQLVEVAVRALSPSINDPFTANTCIDRLGSALCRMAHRGFPSPYKYDEQGQLRLITCPVDFAGAVDAACNPIRQYAKGSIAVTIRLLEMLATVAKQTASDEQSTAVRRQADWVLASCERTKPLPADWATVKERHRVVLAELETKREP